MISLTDRPAMSGCLVIQESGMAVRDELPGRPALDDMDKMQRCECQKSLLRLLVMTLAAAVRPPHETIGSLRIMTIKLLTLLQIVPDTSTVRLSSWVFCGFRWPCCWT